MQWPLSMLINIPLFTNSVENILMFTSHLDFLCCEMLKAVSLLLAWSSFFQPLQLSGLIWGLLFHDPGVCLGVPVMKWQWLRTQKHHWSSHQVGSDAFHLSEIPLPLTRGSLCFYVCLRYFSWCKNSRWHSIGPTASLGLQMALELAGQPPSPALDVLLAGKPSSALT